MPDYLTFSESVLPHTSYPSWSLPWRTRPIQDLIGPLPLPSWRCLRRPFSSCGVASSTVIASSLAIKQPAQPPKPPGCYMKFWVTTYMKGPTLSAPYSIVVRRSILQNGTRYSPWSWNDKFHQLWQEPWYTATKNSTPGAGGERHGLKSSQFSTVHVKDRWRAHFYGRSTAIPSWQGSVLQVSAAIWQECGRADNFTVTSWPCWHPGGTVVWPVGEEQHDCTSKSGHPAEGDRARPRRGRLEAALPEEAAGAKDTSPLPGRQGKGDIFPVTYRLIVCQLTWHSRHFNYLYVPLYTIKKLIPPSREKG